MPFIPSKDFVRQSWIMFVLGLLMTSILFVAIRDLENNRINDDFQRSADDRISALESGLRAAEADLAVVNRLFAVAGPISREQFSQFTDPLLKDHPHIQNFTFHRIVSASQRPAFEAAMRRLYPNFSVRQVVDGKLVPVPAKERYRIIDYVEPMKGNQASFGLDASTRVAQKAAALRACRTGLPSATKPYTLVHKNLTMRGFVMLAPVYRPGAKLDDPVERCNQLLGYTTAVFDGARLVKRALDERGLLNTEGYAVAVYAGSSRNADDLVYRSERVGLSQSSMPFLSRLFDRLPRDRNGSFEVAGLPWQVVVSAAPLPFFKAHLASLFTLMGGIIMSALMADYIRSLTIRSERLRQLHQERSEKLAQKLLMQTRNTQLEGERAHLLTLFDQAPGFVTVLNGPEHIFEIANRAYYALVNYRDIIGKPVREALPELASQGFYELLDHVYVTGEVYVGRNHAITIASEDGSSPTTRFVDFIYQPMTDADGRVTSIFVQGNDISLQTSAQREAEYLAQHDQLTGLPNALQVVARLKKMIIQAESKDESLIMMLIDIDRFKSANERFGPSAANAILKLVSDRLYSTFHGKGLLGRLEGDKFLLVLSSTGEDGVYLAAVQSIRAAMGGKIDIEGYALSLTCSIGIARYPADGDNPEKLIHNAEMALTGAREHGYNNIQFYNAERYAHIHQRLKMEIALRTALERSEFVLHYQPQLDLCTGRVVAVEALIRWENPELGLLQPGAFIQLAEQTGLIVPIGDWALQTACAQLKAWHEIGFGDLRVAVNLSARQFAQENLVGRIRDVLAQNDLDPSHLDIELTESLVMTDVEQAIGILQELSELGVQLSIDDFGTGYSSLSYLKRFPINLIKIDRAFINEITEKNNDAAIADAIISMAHSLGMRVLAEGVETEGQCEFLSRNLCDEIQGFLFSRPVPAHELEALLTASCCLPDHLLRQQKPERKLLLVDDEPSILSALRRQLRQDGYQILTASDGAAGLEVLAQNEIDVIVSDQRMPGMTGVEFLREVKDLYPDTVRIVLSGFTELKSVTDAVNEGAIYKFLTKPWDDTQLREQIAEAFQHKEMADENHRLNMQVRTTNQELASANRKLEDALRFKQQQILRREISLDIVREALQHVPMPIIGLDEEQEVVFANGAAHELFKDTGAMLGNPIDQLVPELRHPIPEDKTEMQYQSRINNITFSIVARRMGQGTQSRGSLIIFTRYG